MVHLFSKAFLPVPLLFAKQMNFPGANALSRAFPKIDDSSNIGNKGLCKEEQNKFSKKRLSPVEIDPGTPLAAHLVLHSIAFLTELS